VCPNNMEVVEAPPSASADTPSAPSPAAAAVPSSVEHNDDAFETPQYDASSVTSLVGGARNSDISVSRFNKWLVAEHKRDTGDEVRETVDSLRHERDGLRENHRQYGASLGAASRAQMQRDKQSYQALRRHNWEKGSQIREDVESQKQEMERLRAEWVEHGRRLAEKDQDQRRKIREVCGEGSKRVTELVQQCKLEEAEYEAALVEHRAKILADNQAEVQKVRQETANTVIDASKQFALERRRSLAKTTKSAMTSWRRERSANTADHLKSARSNRADAHATREKAKKLREELVAQRQRDALAQRQAQKAKEAAKDERLNEMGGGLKTNHDEMYSAKYVPASSADMFNTSDYGNLVA